MISLKWHLWTSQEMAIIITWLVGVDTNCRKLCLCGTGHHGLPTSLMVEDGRVGLDPHMALSSVSYGHLDVGTFVHDGVALSPNLFIVARSFKTSKICPIQLANKVLCWIMLTLSCVASFDCLLPYFRMKFWRDRPFCNLLLQGYYIIGLMQN